MRYIDMLFCFLLSMLLYTGSAPAKSRAALERTIIAPHLDVEIEPGLNVLFVSTFQIAWNRMKNDIIKENIQLEQPLEMVHRLNRGLATAADISEGDYLAMAGSGTDTIASTINRALRVKFGDSAPRIDEIFNRDDTILAYAFLLKELEFEHTFEDFAEPMTCYFGRDRDKTRVEVFGIGGYSDERHRPLCDQVEIVDYASSRNFIIRIASKHPEDELVIARVDPGKTLLETYEAVAWRIARAERDGTIERLREHDVVQIPKCVISIDHPFAPLLGLHLLNRGWEDYFVAEARQVLYFRLDARGAALTAEGIFAIKKGPPANFKDLSLRQPYLLYCKKKDGTYPYLAMWIENSELLITRGD